MKLEYGIIFFVGFLIITILALITSNPNDVPFQTEIIQINQQAILAQETENKEKLEENRTLMQEKLEKIASRSLGMPKLQVFLEEGYFPFKSATDIELFGEPSQKLPICDITPKIIPQLELIQNSHMFSMFTEKYRDYQIELFIQDERRHESIIHYSLIATSGDGNYSASTWFHLNSCNDGNDDQMAIPYNLSCRDKQNDHFMHTRNLGEIVASFEDDKFCEINLEPWRQELYDYTQILSDERRVEERMAAIQDDPTYEKVMAFQLMMDRLGLLGNMASHAMTGEYNDEKMNDMKKEYRESFGKIPDELLELIEK